MTTAYSPGPAGVQPVQLDGAAGSEELPGRHLALQGVLFSERVKLRFNVDAFNAFNIQGLVNPNATDGIQSLQTSYWTPRQIQFTGRLSF